MKALAQNVAFHTAMCGIFGLFVAGAGVFLIAELTLRIALSPYSLYFWLVWE